jgi:hypothetical protein
LANELVQLLPTPAAGLHNYEEDPESFLARAEKLKAKGINGNGAGMPLPIALKLLPTPTAALAGGNGLRIDPPIETPAGEWEWLGATTSPPSDDGKPSTALRLSPWFVEWMIGAPQGWSDPDCPLSATAFACTSPISPASTSSSASGSG